MTQQDLFTPQQENKTNRSVSSNTFCKGKEVCVCVCIYKFLNMCNCRKLVFVFVKATISTFSVQCNSVIKHTCAPGRICSAAQQCGLSSEWDESCVLLLSVHVYMCLTIACVFDYKHVDTDASPGTDGTVVVDCTVCAS